MKSRMMLLNEIDPELNGSTSGTGTPATDPAPVTEPAPAKEDESINIFSEDEVDPPKELELDVEVLDYELELSDDSKIPEEVFDSIVEEAKKHGWTKEEAESRMAHVNKAYESAETKYVAERAESLKKDLFQDERFNSPEKRKEAQEDIARTLKEYKSPELVNLVKNDPLIKNNKTVLKLLADIGKNLRPEGTPKGDQAGITNTQKNSDNILKEYYPSTYAENSY